MPPGGGAPMAARRERVSREGLRQELFQELRGAGVVEGLKTRLRAEVRGCPPPGGMPPSPPG